MNEYVLSHTIYNLVRKHNPQLTNDEIEETVTQTMKNVIEKVLAEVM